MRAISRTSDDPTVIGGPPARQNPIWKRLRPILYKRARKDFKTGNTTIHSIAWPATGLGDELQHLHADGLADIVHLHWLGDHTLSVEEIGSLSMPLVWRLPDQWAFCGAEHYTSPPMPNEKDSTDLRYVEGYQNDNRPHHEQGPDINRHTWLRKRRAWRHAIQIVSPTNWLADCARRSLLMSQWPICIIPTPIDLDTWAPLDQSLARKVLNLSADRPLVVFGAVGGTTDPRKGSDLLVEALKRLRIQVAGLPLENIELIVFGQNHPPKFPDAGFPVHNFGRLQDDRVLRLLYTAADVFVIPSRQDNMPGTGIEAHACGSPIVAFRTGGLNDIVEDGVTGALAEPFDPQALSQAIRWVLDDPQRRRTLARAARHRAERLWSPQRVAGLYCDLYQEVIERHRRP